MESKKFSFNPLVTSNPIKYYRVLDQSRDGRISFTEFQVFDMSKLDMEWNYWNLTQAFEGSLCVPDALYKTAFQLFDTNGNGTVCHLDLTLCISLKIYQVSLDEFVGILSKTTLHQKIPFSFDCDFVKLYFGKEGKRDITYSEFSQFLHDFHEE